MNGQEKSPERFVKKFWFSIRFALNTIFSDIHGKEQFYLFCKTFSQFWCLENCIVWCMTCRDQSLFCFICLSPTNQYRLFLYSTYARGIILSVSSMLERIIQSYGNVVAKVYYIVVSCVSVAVRHSANPSENKSLFSDRGRYYI